MSAQQRKRARTLGPSRRASPAASCPGQSSPSCAHTGGRAPRTAPPTRHARSHARSVCHKDAPQLRVRLQHRPRRGVRHHDRLHERRVGHDARHHRRLHHRAHRGGVGEHRAGEPRAEAAGARAEHATEWGRGRGGGGSTRRGGRGRRRRRGRLLHRALHEVHCVPLLKPCAGRRGAPTRGDNRRAWHASCAALLAVRCESTATNDGRRAHRSSRACPRPSARAPCTPAAAVHTHCRYATAAAASTQHARNGRHIHVHEHARTCSSGGMSASRAICDLNRATVQLNSHSTVNLRASDRRTEIGGMVAVRRFRQVASIELREPRDRVYVNQPCVRGKTPRDRRGAGSRRDISEWAERHPSRMGTPTRARGRTGSTQGVRSSSVRSGDGAAPWDGCALTRVYTQRRVSFITRRLECLQQLARARGCVHRTMVPYSCRWRCTHGARRSKVRVSRHAPAWVTD
jgi:hypothetical protein